MTDSENRSERSLADYQRSLSCFENSNDFSILPGLFLIVRIDAHRVGAWDREDEDYPFSKKFHSTLVDTAERLMLGPVVCAGSYIHGDEISLLLSLQESSNPRKRSKLLSLLSSYASLFANQRLGRGREVVFHAKLSELPDVGTVADYFIWQRLVAIRNSINIILISSCGSDKAKAKEVVKTVSSLNIWERIRYLEDMGIDYWKKDSMFHSGTLLLRDNDGTDRIKGFSAIEGVDSLRLEPLTEKLIEELYESLAITSVALADELLLTRESRFKAPKRRRGRRDQKRVDSSSSGTDNTSDKSRGDKGQHSKPQSREAKLERTSDRSKTDSREPRKNSHRKPVRKNERKPLFPK